MNYIDNTIEGKILHQFILLGIPLIVACEPNNSTGFCLSTVGEPWVGFPLRTRKDLTTAVSGGRNDEVGIIDKCSLNGKVDWTLDIQIPPEVWCFRYVFRVQIPAQEVFGCLGKGLIWIAVLRLSHSTSLTIILKTRELKKPTAARCADVLHGRSGARKPDPNARVRRSTGERDIT